MLRCESITSTTGEASDTNHERCACSSSASRSGHLSAYCHSIAAIPSRKTRKTRETLVGYFELHELDAIFAEIDTSHKDGFRDMAILGLLYNAIARASELCGLQLSDLHRSEPPHVVLRGTNPS